MLKKVLVHKISVALLICAVKPYILVKINRGNLAKVNISLFVPLYKLFICTERDEPVARPSTLSGFKITCAEIIFAACRLNFSYVSTVINFIFSLSDFKTHYKSTEAEAPQLLKQVGEQLNAFSEP